jgi:hypothetical protein
MKNTPDDRIGVVLPYMGKLPVRVSHPLKNSPVLSLESPEGIAELEWGV